MMFLIFDVVQWSRDKAFDSLDGEYFSHNILDRQYTILELQKVSVSLRWFLGEVTG